jgi:hypothetical protein
MNVVVAEGGLGCDVDDCGLLHWAVVVQCILNQ